MLLYIKGIVFKKFFKRSIFKLFQGFLKQNKKKFVNFSQKRILDKKIPTKDANDTFKLRANF